MTRLADSPAWLCFRQDLQRHWRARTVGRLLLMLAGILLVQLLVSYLLLHLVFPARAAASGWALQAASFLGLFSPFAAFVSAAPGGPAGLDRLARAGLVMSAFSGVPVIAYHFFLPAFAASSIAPERERGNVGELLLAGMTPREILAAKGAAAILPFAGALVVGLLLAVPVYYLDYLPALRSYAEFAVSTGPAFAARLNPGLYFARSILTPFLTFGLVAGITVCISAICRRAVTALAWCYAIVVLIIPMLGATLSYAVSNAAHRQDLSLASAWTEWGWIGTPTLEAAALAVLVPLALHSLSHPDPQPKVRPRRTTLEESGHPTDHTEPANRLPCRGD